MRHRDVTSPMMFKSQPTSYIGRSRRVSFRKLYESSFSSQAAASTSAGVTELPLDFFDMLSRCVDRTVSCINSGTMLIRIDYDTTVGDMTYTSLKNTIPMLKELTKLLAVQMDLSVPPDFEKVETSDEDADLSNADVAEASQDPAEVEDAKKSEDQPFPITRSLRIFYPDMGEAVLARREWKLGTKEAEVPPCVMTANIQNDMLGETDRIAIILCPQYSETDYVQRIIDMCNEKSIPCIMINPALINMDQGFGASKSALSFDKSTNVLRNHIFLFHLFIWYHFF